MFCLITLNRVKLRRAVTFIKYLDNVVFLLSLPKALSRNIIAFLLSNSLNPRELEVNEFDKSISKTKQYLIGKLFTDYFFYRRLVFIDKHSYRHFFYKRKHLVFSNLKIPLVYLFDFKFD